MPIRKPKPAQSEPSSRKHARALIRQFLDDHRELLDNDKSDAELRKVIESSKLAKAICTYGDFPYAVFLDVGSEENYDRGSVRILSLFLETIYNRKNAVPEESNDNEGEGSEEQADSQSEEEDGDPDGDDEIIPKPAFVAKITEVSAIDDKIEEHKNSLVLRSYEVAANKTTVSKNWLFGNIRKFAGLLKIVLGVTLLEKLCGWLVEHYPENKAVIALATTIDVIWRVVRFAALVFLIVTRPDKAAKKFMPQDVQDNIDDIGG